MIDFVPGKPGLQDADYFAYSVCLLRHFLITFAHQSSIL